MVSLRVESSFTAATRCVRRLRVFLLAAGLSLGYADLPAQTLEGVLLDRDSNQPIELGLITLFAANGDSVASVLTDQAGRFRVGSPTGGEFLLGASALGYEYTVASSLFTLADGADMSLQFRIRPIPLALRGITVEARRSLFRTHKLVQNGFVERAESGFGRFITPHDIETSPAPSTADLLARTGRVTTRYGVSGAEVLMLGTGGFCTPIIYVDGARLSLSGGGLEAMVPLSVLEAAEVYRSATEAPVRYGGGMGGCGIIVLWTKSR